MQLLFLIGAVSERLQGLKQNLLLRVLNVFLLAFNKHI